MAGLTTRYYSLSGGLNTSYGLGTINSTPRLTESPETYNVEPYKLSGLKSQEGNKQIGQTLSATIALGLEYRQGRYKYMIVCTTDGYVWEFNKSTDEFKIVYKFPTATRRYSACQFNFGVVLSNGVDDLVFYSHGRDTRLTGDITVVNNSTTVTGTGAKFTTELSKGDYIRIPNIGEYNIESITSDTELELTEPISMVSPNITYYGWKDSDDIVRYTTTLDNGRGIIIYKKVGSDFVQDRTDGVIADGVLSYEEIRTETQTVTNILYFCMETAGLGDGEIMYVSGQYKRWFADSANRYVYFRNGAPSTEPIQVYKTIAGNYGQLNATNNQANLGNFAVTRLEPNGATYVRSLTASSMVTSTDGTYPGVVGLTNYAGTYDWTVNVTRSPENDITSTTTITNEIIETDTFERDTTSDEVIEIPLTDIPYYLTPISELNAVYINSDDPTVNYPIRGLALQSYQGRIWVGANDGNLYYSEVGLIHGWDVKYGAGAIPPFYNDNSNFTALGTYADYLIVHKQDNSYYIDGTGEEDTWRVVPYSNHSCDSQQSWIEANNSYYIYSRLNGGIYPFMARTAFINHYLGQEISTKIREDFRLIDNGRYSEIYPVYHPVKKYLMFYMPMLQGKGSNICYIYDFISRGWWMRKLPQDVTMAFQFDNAVYIGTRDGKVLKEFSGLTFDNEPIEFCWKSPWFQYGDGTNYHSTREFRCKISEEYSNNFYVRNRRDGYDEFHQRNVTNNKDAFEALEWSNPAGDITDTVWDEFDWVEVGYLIKRFPIPDQFFTSQQIEFYGKVKNEAMCLLGFELDRVEKEDCPW